MGAQTCYPVLRYADAPAALTWLIKAFGFTEQLVVPGPEGMIAHAQLRFGDGIVMLSSAGDDAPDQVTPRSARATTFAVHVHVADVDTHHARAKAAGAEIVSELQDTGHGSRDYTVRDPEGHLWAFSTYGP